ncbi:MAG: hypothetical protein JKY86_12320 [Gammaproteobacteria bacterium]|nr:hypothetical protein [Gammaproteobacteria bacterium]
MKKLFVSLCCAMLLTNSAFASQQYFSYWDIDPDIGYVTFLFSWNYAAGFPYDCDWELTNLDNSSVVTGSLSPQVGGTHGGGTLIGGGNWNLWMRCEIGSDWAENDEDFFIP